jgi:hypothetical protein
LIAIHPSFEKLLTSLRTAVANEYKLDKEQTSYNDILDAFRLALQFYKRSKTRTRKIRTVSIIIKRPPVGPYYCNLDNIRLGLQNKETGEYICPRCSASYFPNLGEKVKRANNFEVPEGRDKTPLLSLVDDSSTEPSTVNKQPKLPRSFEMLKQTGGKDNRLSD